jgi:lysozyme
MGLAQTTRLISLEEGCKLTAYKDSRGIWTIGWGYNLESHGYSRDECEGLTWTQEQADAALADEIQGVMAELDRRWPKWRDLDEVRQAAIVSSVYQLGAPGASKFFATIHAIQSRDWDTAATQILASRWGKQTPNRVQRNAEMIRSGRWPEEVNGVRFSIYAPAVPAPTLVQSAAPVLPSDGLPDAPEQGQAVGRAVGADLPSRARLIAILAGLSKSKTAYGVLGLLGMQLLGAQTWDVAIRIGGQIYAVPDLAPYVSTALAALATWGRITAKPIGGRNA